MSSVLNKQILDIKKPSAREWLYFLLIILIPNLVLLGICYTYNFARPLVNTDYLVCLCLLLIPNRWVRAVGLLGFAIAILLDITMLIMQVVPMVDLGALVSLAAFLGDAPTEYIALTAFLVVYIIAMSGFVLFLSKRKHFTRELYIIPIILIISFFIKDIKYSGSPNYEGVMGRSNHFVVNSQFSLMDQMLTTGWFKAMNTTPTLIPYPTVSPNDSNIKLDRAITHFTQPTSNKILFVIVESLAGYRNPQIITDLASPIAAHSDKLEYLETGDFATVNSNTIGGEMRELCNKAIKGGYAFRRLDAQEFADCIPNQMLKQGYQTTSLVGVNGRFVDYIYWYPKAGFQKSWFLDSFANNLRHCQVFHGVCDTEIPKIIAQEVFQPNQPKQFVYWLTLTAHAPYHLEDLTQPNPNVSCEKYKINENTETCRNIKLNGQLFRAISTIIDQPNMKGVEVVMVGDHKAPIYDYNEEDYLIYKPELAVSWVHFKIK